MLSTLLVWSTVLALTFEFARVTRSFDYQTFFRNLLGWGAPAFEISYVILILLVLSVLGAAAGSIVGNRLGFPSLVGSTVLMVLVAFVLFFGSKAVERLLSVWAIVLYAVFISLVAFSLADRGDQILASLRASSMSQNWVVAGIIYAGYNLASAPSVIFCCRHMTRRREAIIAGMLGGLLAILPGVFLYLAMLGYYPEIVQAPVPSAFLIDHIGSGPLQMAFDIALFGTLVKTGVGLLHAINERVSVRMANRGETLPRSYRAIIAVGVMIVAIFAAERFGIIGLIARGYGTLTYVFIAIYVIPLMTLGAWRIVRDRTLTVE
jgi:uncharacterized membrane protein YkvI